MHDVFDMHLSQGDIQSMHILDVMPLLATVMPYWLSRHDTLHCPFDRYVDELHWVQLERDVHCRQLLAHSWHSPLASA